MGKQAFSLNPYSRISSIDDGVRLSKYIYKPMFTTGDVGISRKDINYWDKENVLLSTRKEGERWRKYSFVEYVWLKIVEQLRLFGAPFEMIRTLKQEISTAPSLEEYLHIIKDFGLELNPDLSEKEKKKIQDILDKGNFSEYKDEQVLPFLPQFIADAVILKCNISFFIFENGDFIPYYEGVELPYELEDLHKIDYKPYIRISLSGIINEFLKDESSFEFLPDLNILSPEEEALMDIVQSGEYDKITIHFKDKKINALELTKSQDVKKRIVDIIQENEYQEVVIKKHKGIVTTIKNTVKVFMDKEK